MPNGIFIFWGIFQLVFLCPSNSKCLVDFLNLWCEENMEKSGGKEKREKSVLGTFLKKAYLRNLLNGSALKKLKVHLVVMALFIPLSCALALIFPFVLCVYLFRYLLFHLAWRCHPRLGKMLSTRSALIATDWPYDQPLFNLLTILMVQEPLTLSKGRQFLQHILDQKSTDNDSLKYPELRQYVSKCLGFTFWKQDPDFDLDNHFGELLVSSTSLEPANRELRQILNQLITRPFPERRSPWEVILVRASDGSGQTLILWLWHHCLYDGFATIQLFAEIVSNNMKTDVKLEEAKDSDPFRSYSNRQEEFGKYRAQHYGSWWKILKFGLTAPYELVKANVEAYDPIRSDSWHLPEKELRREWWTASAGEEIDIGLVKEVKEKFGVSFTAVLTEGMTAAARNLMLKNPRRELPRKISAGFPLPIPRNSHKLRNYWALTTVNLPVGESDPLKRLRIIEKNLNKVKRSTVPIMSLVLLPMLGALFEGLMKLVFSNRYTSMIVSIMPGPKEKLRDINDEFTVQGIEFTISLAQGNTGFGISALSYNGKIRIVSTVDKGISEEEAHAQEMANDVLKSIQDLSLLSANSDIELV